MEFGYAQLNTYRYILKNIYQYCHYIFFYTKNQGYLRYYFVFKREKTIPKLLSGIFFRYSEYYLLNNARREEIRMEERIIKTSVFFNDTLFNETAEQPIDVDLTLPDYCPDISKIFKCRAFAGVSAKSLNGRNITVDGSVCITVLYSDDEGRLCSYEYQYPFSKNLEMKEECTGGSLSVRARCEYVNCRAVTGRKVDIHGAVGITVRVFKRKSTDIISDADISGIEQKCESAPATVPMGCSEKYLMIEEDIPIGQGQPSVCRVLRYDACPCVKESKIISGKIVVKGDMSVKILYCTDEGTPQTVKTVIPFSQIVDMEGVGDSCECDTRADTAFLEIKPRLSEGETKSFALTAKLLLTCSAYCGNDIAVITDAFSRKYRMSMKKESICFEKICDTVRENYNCKKSIELDGPTAKVYDIWCDLQSVSTKFEAESMVICGTAVICLITGDEEDRASYFEKAVDFEYSYPLNRSCENLKSDPELEVLSCGYTLTGAESMEIRIDIGINASIYECRKMSLITDMETDENAPAEQTAKCAMTIYFTGDGECVWDIAKHYNASVKEIMKINELEGECLPAGKMLLIPAL